MDTQDVCIESSLDAIRQFESGFKVLLNPNSRDALALYSSLRSQLQRFHLDSLYSENYVLNEAYLRARQCLMKGGTIRNPYAWIRGASRLIIRELSRAQKRVVHREDDAPVFQDLVAHDWDFGEDEGATANQAVVREAFSTLSHMEQRILSLKVVEERPWKTIREVLRSEDLGDHSEAALRQKKKRSLDKLRKAYYALRPAQ
jgi:DNA-directed RNA polymerase specialized sigma24 family protein